MDRSKYTENCLHIVQTEQFTILKHDETKCMEKKYNRTCKNWKLEWQFKSILYGTTKLRKPLTDGALE